MNKLRFGIAGETIRKTHYCGMSINLPASTALQDDGGVRAYCPRCEDHVRFS